MWKPQGGEPYVEIAKGKKDRATVSTHPHEKGLDIREIILYCENGKQTAAGSGEGKP